MCADVFINKPNSEPNDPGWKFIGNTDGPINFGIDYNTGAYSRRDGRRNRGNGNMDLNEYQGRTDDTAHYPNAGTGDIDALNYAVLGLIGEAGELANKLKKHYRDATPYPVIREQMLNELGDVLYYIARVATELDIELERVAEVNISKLADRKERGVLGGNGDNR